MTRFRYYCAVFFLTIVTCYSQTIKPRYHGFPKPLPNKDMLFYLQRTIDYNTVIYELNYEKSGKLNRKEPIKMYWIDYEKGGKVSLLTYAQHKFAYGIEAKEIEELEGAFEIKLVAYRKKLFRLATTGLGGIYEMRTMLKGREVILKKIFVNIVGGTLLRPDVKDITVTGIDVLTGVEVLEILVP